MSEYEDPILKQGNSTRYKLQLLDYSLFAYTMIVFFASYMSPTMPKIIIYSGAASAGLPVSVFFIRVILYGWNDL